MNKHDFYKLFIEGLGKGVGAALALITTLPLYLIILYFILR